MIYNVSVFVYRTDTRTIRVEVGHLGVTAIEIEPGEASVRYQFTYIDEAWVERKADGCYCGDAWWAREVRTSSATRSEYYNDRIMICGRNQEVLNMAANLLMPPQFEEFVEVLSGSRKHSMTTRAYWEEKYEQWLENVVEGS